MDAAKHLRISGLLLLSGAALLGFVQHRHRRQPDAFARWRVVHAGGTAGAIQLLALSAVWRHAGASGTWLSLLAVGIVLATWALFVGPMAKALGYLRAAAIITGLGALVAVPCYLALPLVAFL